VISDHYSGTNSHCFASIFYAYCASSATKADTTKLGNVLLDRMDERQKNTMIAVKNSEHDLLNKIQTVTETITTDIDLKTQAINQSLTVIENSLNYMYEELSNMAGFLSSSF